MIESKLIKMKEREQIKNILSLLFWLVNVGIYIYMDLYWGISH